MQITPTLLTRHQASASHGITRFLACLLLLGVLALPYVFLEGFSGLQLFDDEGTLMITIRDLKQGLHLYDESYALYGPFYYLTIGGLFTKLHVPLVHDSLRIISSVFRLACAGLLGTLTFRLTRSVLSGLFTSLALLILYSFMPHSPTHPQEICLVLVTALPHLLLSMEKASPRAGLLLMAAVGACLAALLLIKINIGVFAALALILTGLRAMPGSNLLRLITGLVIGSSLLLPFVLMLPLLHFSWTMMYCFGATAAIGASTVAWLGCKQQDWLTPARLWLCLAAMATVAVITLGATLASGSSLYGMLNAIVLQNGHFIRNWYVPMPYSAASIAAGAVALLASLYARRARPHPGAQTIIAFSKLAVGAGGILAFAPIMLGLDWWDTRLVVFQFVTPFSFLLLLPADQRSTLDAGRISLGLLATFMFLYAFPVASDQIAVAESLSVVYLPLLFREGLRALDPLLAGRPARSHRSAAALGWLLVAIYCGGLVKQTRYAWWRWGGSVSSDLPGAALIHVSPTERAGLQWVLQQLATCPAFYTFPGVLSFYFWTGRSSPTPLNSNDTLGLLSAPQQDQVVAALARQQGLCIVFTPKLLDIFDRGQIAARPPLLRYIDENYVKTAQYGSYEILTAKIPQ